MTKHNPLFRFILIFIILSSIIFFIKTKIIYFLAISVVSLICSIYLFSAKDSNINGEKLCALEGLRGAASFIVVMDHFLYAFFPALFFPLQYAFHYPIEKVITSSPLSVFYNGDLSVVMFFILSGFVLSFKFFKKNYKEVAIAGFIKRFPRLTIHIIFSCFISYLMLKFNLFCNFDWTAITHSDWAAKQFAIHPDFLRALFDSFLGVYITWTDYNPVLWTMKIELLGSFLVFLNLFLFSYIKKRNILYFIFMAIFCKSYYLCFIIGMIMADLYNSDKYDYFKNNFYLKISAFVSGVFLCSFPFLRTDNSIYKVIENGFSSVLKSESLIKHVDLILLVIGSTFLLHSILYSRVLNRFFSIDIMRFLGKISFSLYFMHSFIIFSLSTYIFKFLLNSYHYPYYLSFWISFVISMPLILILSYFIYLYIDSNSINFSKIFYQQVKYYFIKIKEKLSLLYIEKA